MICFLFIIFLYSAEKSSPVIKSDEMHVIKKNLVRFTGNARLIHSSGVVTADEIIKDETKKIIETKGNVKFNIKGKNQDEKYIGSCDYAFYNENDNFLKSESYKENVKLERFSESKDFPYVYLEGSSIIYSEKEHNFNIRNHLYTVIKNTEGVTYIKADNGDYKIKNRLLNCNGNIDLKFETQDGSYNFTATNGILDIENKKVSFSENIKGKILIYKVKDRK